MKYIFLINIKIITGLFMRDFRRKFRYMQPKIQETPRT
jgi:hypothetical protein